MSATFRDFFFKFLIPYKIIGITPFKNSANKLNVNLCFPQTFIVALVVLIYWLGVVMTFIVDRSTTYALSVIANWIQVITNAVALTIALTYPLLKEITVNSIIKLFEKVDAELSYLQIKLNYKSDTRKYRILLFSCFLLLLSSTVFDFVVSIHVLQNIKVWYWFVTILPLLVYTFALSQAFIVIGFIKQRCQLINEVILEFESSDTKSMVLAKNIVLVSIFNDKKPIISLSELFSKLFIALNDLCELSHHIEHLFGPLFLTTFGAIFAVTSIQLFYCYLVIVTPTDFFKKNTTWPLIQSINIIVINLMLVIGITSICENVSLEVRKIITHTVNFIKLFCEF